MEKTEKEIIRDHYAKIGAEGGKAKAKRDRENAELAEQARKEKAEAEK